MKGIESKIKGALYGFAIGDAMGATTEFMTRSEITDKYGVVTNIMGGGWLHLEPGQVTDDTQMMLCVCDAIKESLEWEPKNKVQFVNLLLNNSCKNLTEWFESDPVDIGSTCRVVLNECAGLSYMDWFEVAQNPESLGNGSLLRILPIAICGLGVETAMLEGRLTHNNLVCDLGVQFYYRNFNSLMMTGTFINVENTKVEPTGHILHTLSNALMNVQVTTSFEKSIIRAVNMGGDADSIAAITGSLAGALYGYKAIPADWVERLDPEVKEKLDFYTKLFKKFFKKGCTNIN